MELDDVLLDLYWIDTFALINSSSTDYKPDLHMGCINVNALHMGCINACARKHMVKGDMHMGCIMHW